MRHIFIVNRISGQGKALKFVPIIERVAKKYQLDYEILYTEKENDAKIYAQKYHDNDIIIYSAGGDGTLFEIVNGIKDTSTLCVLPLGSGNDFCRLISNEKNVEKILIDSIIGHQTSIDYALCNDYKWINVTSFGIDAEINATASKWIRKGLFTKGPAYIFSIIKNMINLKSHHYTIKVDGETLKNDYYIVAVLNGRYYGNGVPACPDASVQDGYLDLCLVPKISFFKVYPLLIKYLSGKHLNDPDFKRIKAKDIDISCDEMVNYQSDGENNMTNHVHISIKEKALKMIIPNNSKHII